MRHDGDVTINGNGLVVIRSCRIKRDLFSETTEFERLVDRGEAEKLWGMANLCDAIGRMIARSREA